MEELISENEIKINFTQLHARLIVIKPLGEEFEIVENGKLVGLDYNGYKIEINKKFKIKGKNSEYKIQYLEKMTIPAEGGIGYYGYCYNRKFNVSTNFIMPIIGGKKESFRFSSNFCSAFIGTEFDGDYGDNLYLLYRFSGTKEFTDFDLRLQSHPEFISCTVNMDKYHLLYKFNIPDKYKEDIKLILDGKYSSISSNYKRRILDFFSTDVMVAAYKRGSTDPLDSPLGEILTKNSNKRRRMENDLNVVIPRNLDLYDVPNPEQEVFLNKYIIERDEEAKWD